VCATPRAENKIGLHRVKIREAIRLIEEDGWYLDRTRGSHRQYRHPSKPGLVTIAGKPGDELAPGTKNSILKQSGLK
jgi:predicted RNA binding protein YcfA (HicA-like mRNA interferase family)